VGALSEHFVLYSALARSNSPSAGMMPKFVWRIWSQIGVSRRIILFTVVLKALLLPKLLISAQKELIGDGLSLFEGIVVYA
jgi:hypothetical protein